MRPTVAALTNWIAPTDEKCQRIGVPSASVGIFHPLAQAPDRLFIGSATLGRGARKGQQMEDFPLNP
jgi:hypothetical protein